jgi:hypothetical protein
MAAEPSYGTPNWDLIKRWFALPPEEDGPFWALNLMRYHEKAQYADGRGSELSGQDADDAYTPRGPLAGVGAEIGVGARVTRQLAGTPGWHRIGIVNYPSRAAFFAMQQRDDFKDQHVHKEAGMEFTIVMATRPAPGAPVVDLPEEGTVVLRVRRFAEGTARPAEPTEGVTSLLTFDVEGVIVGDDRRWDEVRFDLAADDAALAALAATGEAEGVEEAQILVVAGLVENRLAQTVRTPANGVAG